MALKPIYAAELIRLLAVHKKLDHVKVKTYGDSLILSSGESTQSRKLARLTHIGGDQWGLSLPQHTGKWEKTPFVDEMSSLADTLINDFRCFLEELDP